MCYKSVSCLKSGGIYSQKDEKEDGESPEGGASVAEEWQRNAYHRA